MTGQPYAMRLAGFGVRRPKAPNPGPRAAGTVASVGQNVQASSLVTRCTGRAPGRSRSTPQPSQGCSPASPRTCPFEQASTAPISGVTALQAVRKAGVTNRTARAGHRASGGVGTFAVQIAKAFGAEVTGVCSTGKVELVRSIGADHVVDYTREQISDRGRRYDVILDIAGNRTLSELRRALDDRGVLVIVGGETGGRWLGGFDRSLRAVLLAPFVSQSLGMLTSKENTADLDALRRADRDGGRHPGSRPHLRDLRDGLCHSGRPGWTRARKGGDHDLSNPLRAPSCATTR